ncbi:MAG: hypothetical protein H5T50_08725 [Nitrososphaeria archaeon]|nr:hypothetical protein [Nitrososphaeria archaeon]
MNQQGSKTFLESWNDLGNILLKVGDALIRIGVFLALVYGVYHAIYAGWKILNGAPVHIGSEPITSIINSIITFVCLAILYRFVERKISSKSFRIGGLAALIVGAILLVVASIAGFIIIFGGFFIILAVEIRRPAASF